MTLSTNVQNLAIRVGSEAKALRTLINGNDPDLGDLQTVAKGNLVAAINELHAAVSGAGASIDDSGTSSASVWSSSKTNMEIGAAIAALVDGAPEALDTLNELASALGDDPDFATTITNLIGQKANTSDVVKYTDAASTGTAGIVRLSTTAEATAGTDATRAVTPAALRAVTGDPATDFVAVFEAAL